MKKTLLLLALLLISIIKIMQAQELGGPLKDLGVSIPPSPTVASITKFGNIPVSLFTGTPNINIPIWEVKSGKLSVPISLSYHASGIKVQEIAGWVGLNWGLNTGGVISRTMNGKPDESDNGYMRNGNLLPDGGNSWYPEYGIAADIADGLNAIEPDIFSFNFPGYSGRMVYDVHDNCFYTIPRKNLKINQTKALGQWEIITDDGTRYFFGYAYEGILKGIEKTSVAINDDGYQYNSAWHLIEMISSDGLDTIKFKYEQELIPYDLMISRTEYESQTMGCNPMGSNTSYSRSDIITQKIVEIESSNTIVKFKRETNRADLHSNLGSKLKYIEVYSKKDLELYIRKFQFDYGYYNSESSDYLDKRLRLDSLTEFSQTGDKPPYKFCYNTGELPSRQSKKIDHWGFFNGQQINDNLGTLIPEWINSDGIGQPGAIRDVGEAFLINGIMNKMVYPTGGWTEFQFEANGYSKIGRHIISDEEFSETVESVSTEKIYLEVVDDMEIKTEALEIDHDQFISITLSFRNHDPEPAGGTAIIRASNGNILSEYYRNDNTNIERWITKGSYVVEVKNQNLYDTSSIKINYKKNTTTTTHRFKENKAGGLRIRKIQDFDKHGVKANEKEFLYIRSNDNNRSSGFLVSSFPEYTNIYTARNVGTSGSGMPDILGDCRYLVRNSRNVLFSGTTNGSHIGYEEVLVKRLNNGYTYHKYSNFSDYGCNTFPYPPLVSLDWKRGQLMQKTYFNENKTPVRNEIYNYEFDATLYNKVIEGAKIGWKIRSGFRVEAYDELAIELYKIETGWPYLKSKMTIEYSENGSDPITQIETFLYENFKLKSNTLNTSTGDTIISEYKYPDQYAEYSGTDQPAMAIDVMKEKHIIGNPIEQSVYVKDQNNFKKFKSSKLNTFIPYKEGVVLTGSYVVNDLLPDDINKSHINASGFIMDTRYDKELDVNYIDLDGANLLVYEIKNGIKACILKAYNGQLPVVKAANVDSSQFMAAMIGNTVKEIQSFNNEELKLLYNQLNNNLPENAVLTTYLYDLNSALIEQADPNGIITYYSYDGFGRLIEVKNQDKHILKSIDYHIQQSVNYNSLEANILGPHQVCRNTKHTFSINPVENASSYEWSVEGNGNVISQSNNIAEIKAFSGFNIIVKLAIMVGTSEKYFAEKKVKIRSSKFYAPVTIQSSVSGSICPGTSVTLTAIDGSLDGNAKYAWYKHSIDTYNLLQKITKPDIEVKPNQTTNYIVRIEDECSASDAASKSINVLDAVGDAIKIVGPSSLCHGGGDQSYTIDPAGNTSSYLWSCAQETGWHLYAATSSKVILDFGMGGVIKPGYLTVKVSENRCSTNEAKLWIDFVDRPNVSIRSASMSVCKNSTKEFRASSVAGATNYTWKMGSTIIYSGSKNYVNINFNTYNLGVHILSVTASIGGCSDSDNISLTVIDKPVTPSIPYGNSTVCSGSTSNYHISSVSNATSYSWTYPSGATITSGNGSRSVDIRFGSNSGGVRVAAVNGCGTGLYSDSKPVTVEVVNSPPTKPGSISGETNTGHYSTQEYRINAVSGAKSYEWTVPAGATIFVNDGTSITVKFGTSSGNVRVKAVNCGMKSEASYIQVKVTDGGGTNPV